MSDINYHVKFDNICDNILWMAFFFTFCFFSLPVQQREHSIACELGIILYFDAIKNRLHIRAVI